MEVIYSKTGSKGNASVISDGNTMIQIDAGIGLKKVNEGIGYKIHEVVGIICTHHHCDHISAVTDYLRFGKKVYALKETWEKTKISGSKRNCRQMEYKHQFCVGSFIVMPFKVEHCDTDGEECENAGLLLYSKNTEEKMLWITDASYVEAKFPAVDYIAIECNYIDVEDYAKELQYINQFVESRRLNSHLSLSRCVKFLKNQDLSKIKKIYLLHISESQGKIEEEILKRMREEFPNIEFVAKRGNAE